MAERGSVTVDCRAGEDTLTIVVRDTGADLGRDQQRHFALRGNGGDRTAHAGAGRGLFTVRRFAADLGGTVALHGEPGRRGSEFRVTVPLVVPRSTVARAIA